MAKTITTDTLRELYLLTFDSFAIGTDELARAAGLTVDEARRAMKRMTGSLVCDELQEDHGAGGIHTGSSRLVGKNIVWQCYYTYDYIKRDEAEALFDRWAAEGGAIAE